MMIAIEIEKEHINGEDGSVLPMSGRYFEATEEVTSTLNVI